MKAAESACSFAYHRAIKRSRARWETATEPPSGHQARPVVPDSRGFEVEYGNCCLCKSTLILKRRAAIQK